MNYKVKESFSKSSIINFFASLNRNLLLFFFNSRTYKLFLSINTFFKEIILKNADKSLIVNLIKKAVAKIKLKDTGVFILLVVLFNTLAMVFLGKVIDIFSIGARISFLILGIILIRVTGHE